jgi:hypothetical protein
MRGAADERVDAAASLAARTDVPADLHGVIAALLDPDPNGRPASAAEVAAALDAVGAGRSIPVRAIGGATGGAVAPAAGGSTTTRRRRFAVGSLGAVAAVGVVGVAMQFAGADPDPDRSNRGTSTTAVGTVTALPSNAPSSTAPDASTSTSAAPSATLAGAEQEVPLPPSASPLTADDLQVIAVVAVSRSDVAAFYSELTGPWTVEPGSLAEADELTSFVLRGPDRDADVELTDTAVTAASGITQIRIRFRVG